MTGMLLSKGFVASFGAGLEAAAAEAGVKPEALHLPDDARARLGEADCARIEVAYLTRDIRCTALYHSFGATVSAAPNLTWVHFASTGIDQHPFLAALIERGVRLTTSAGSNGEPVGHTAICGLLMLARGVPHWLDAQRRHAWEPMRGAAVPRDLRGRTVAVVGLGNIGAMIARFCHALGMHVIGVRRSPQRPADPVDEMLTVAGFRAALPRCD